MKIRTAIGMVFLAILVASSCLNNPVTMLLSSKGGALVRMGPPPGRRDTPHDERCTGYPFHALLQNTDQWECVRSTVDYFEYPDWILNQQQFFSDEELVLYFSIINTWPSKFSLGSSCLKGDYNCQRLSAEESFWTYVFPMWIRFEGLGAQIDELTIDESFCATRKPTWLGPPGDDYAVQETAEWIYLVRTEFDPDIEICSIEPYPFFDIDELIWWIDELNAACDVLGVDGIQAFSLDVNWNIGVSWSDVAAFEDSCQARHIRFEMIYWAAQHWQETDEDVDFFNDIHQQGRMYQAAGGTPDVYSIQNWNYIPRQMVPEEEPWSFTYSLQSFVNTFVPK